MLELSAAAVCSVCETGRGRRRSATTRACSAASEKLAGAERVRLRMRPERLPPL